MLDQFSVSVRKLTTKEIKKMYFTKIPKNIPKPHKQMYRTKCGKWVNCK